MLYYYLQKFHTQQTRAALTPPLHQLILLFITPKRDLDSAPFFTLHITTNKLK